MLIRNILEESVRKFDEVKAVKWLKKKEIMERSYGELMENVVSTRKGLLAEGFEGKQDVYKRQDPRCTLGDGIGESLRNMGISRTETRRKVEELLDRCGLEKEYADRYPQIVYLSCV